MFLAAVVIAGLLLTVMAVWIIVWIADWLLALPMVLFEEMGGRQAMLASKESTSGHRRKIALWLVEWIMVVVLLSESVLPVVGPRYQFEIKELSFQKELVSPPISSFLMPKLALLGTACSPRWNIFSFSTKFLPFAFLPGTYSVHSINCSLPTAILSVHILSCKPPLFMSVSSSALTMCSYE